MLKNNIIVKNHDDFEDLKLRLSEEAKMDGKECYVSESIPYDYPCLVKLIQMDDVDFQIAMDGDMDGGMDDTSFDLTDEEQTVIDDESHGIFYDFIFITQTEIKKLLEA